MTIDITATCGWCRKTDSVPSKVGNAVTLPAGWQLRHKTMVVVWEGDAGYHREQDLVLCISCFERAERCQARAERIAKDAYDAALREVWGDMAHMMDCVRDVSEFTPDNSRQIRCNRCHTERVHVKYNNTFLCDNCGKNNKPKPTPCTCGCCPLCCDDEDLWK